MAADTIIHRLFAQGTTRPHAPAYFVRKASGWVPTNWKDYGNEVRQAAKALIGLDLAAGVRVCILGFNRPEWIIMNCAAMAIGGAAAGIYTTSSPTEVQYIVHHAEAPVVLVENKSQWEKILAQLPNLPHLRHVVLMKGAEKVDHPMVLSWEQFLAKAEHVKSEALQERVDGLEPDGVAVLIYTSGTTGPPKGVMLSHQNLAFTAEAARELTNIGPDDCNLSYLPLSHIAEQVFTVHGPATTGGSVYFAESIDKLPDNLKEVQPTVFFGVPRIWEKFYAKIGSKLGEAEGAKKKIAEWARGVSTEVTALRCVGDQPTGLLAIKYAIANKLVFSKLKPAIGLGRARFCVSGAAPISKEILEFFGSLDILVHEVYGQSEDCGPTSCNLPGRTKLGTVGPAVKGVTVKIAEDGEILIKGPNVFLGYFKEPEATAEALRDGWLYSGDLGAFDDQGYLSITGRKKDIIITAGGKNIAPKNIESALKNDALISEAVVIGDQRKFLSVLLTLDEEAATKFAEDLGDAPKDLHKHRGIQTEIQRAVDAVNAELAQVEKVKKFTILHRNLTMEQGELTPTLKVKRKNVNTNWATEIEAMYAE